MKIEFKLNNFAIEKYKKEINDIERMIQNAGLQKVSDGVYIGNKIPYEVMSELQIRISVKDWFRDNAEYLYFHYAEDNSDGQEILFQIKRMNRIFDKVFGNDI